MSGRFKHLMQTGKGKRPLREKQPTEDGKGKNWVTVGHEEYTYEINIDWDDILSMAAKAGDSRGGQCIAGPIQLKIRTRRKL